jgi:hypothetical protein
MMSSTIDEQRLEYCQRVFLATPLAGILAWTLVGVTSFFVSEFWRVWILFIGTGSIVYLGIFISKFTGENFMDQTKPKNEFDRLFLFTVFQSLLSYGIAIPFFLLDSNSLPISIGILTGSMWIPFSRMIQHWVGVFHALARTSGILVLGYAFPDHRFSFIPVWIVFIYIITILVLQKRRANLIRSNKSQNL